MPIWVPAAAQYFFHRLCAASSDSGPPWPLMDARNSGPEVYPARSRPQQRDVAAVVEQHGADGAALAVDAGVLVVREQVQVPDVHPADLRGAGAAGVGSLEQHPVLPPDAVVFIVLGSAAALDSAGIEGRMTICKARGVGPFLEDLGYRLSTPGGFGRGTLAAADVRGAGRPHQKDLIS
jgi:hypothetical protein